MKPLFWKECRELWGIPALFAVAFFAALGLQRIPLFGNLLGTAATPLLIPWGAALVAVGLGADLLAKERRNKTLEYLLVRPVTASRIVWTKTLAGAIVLLSVVAIFLAFILSQGSNPQLAGVYSKARKGTSK